MKNWLVHTTLALALLLAGFNGNTQINVDSLVKILPRLNDRQKVLTLSDISFEYAFSNRGKCMEYAHKTLDAALKTRNDTLISEGFNSMAIAYQVQQEFDSALRYNFKALAIRKKLKDERGQASSLAKIGNIYTDRGKIPQSIEIYLQILPIYEKDKDKTNYASVLTNIVNSYSLLKDIPKLGVYNRLSLRMLPQVSNAMLKGRIYGNMGNYYQARKMPDSALYYAHKALGIFEPLEAFAEVSGIYNNMGITYRIKGDNKTAFTYYQKAYALAKQLNQRYDIAYYACNSGFVLKNQRRLDEAEKFFKEGEKISRDNNLTFTLKMAYEGLSNVYELRGNAAKALEYHKLFTQTKDSLLNEEKAKAVEEMEARYMNERQLKLNRELELEKKDEQLKRVNAETVSATKSKYIILIAAGAVILLLVVYLFYQLRQRRLREEYNRQIIHEKEEGLKAVIYATEDERKRIAKDLHDSVGQQMTGLKMAWQQLSGQIHTENNTHFGELVRITQVLDDASAEVRSISHQMMPRVLTEIGLVPAIDDMLKKTLGNTSIAYEFDQLGMQPGDRFGENIEISLYRICQELVNNIIKHSGATKAHFQLILNKRHIVLLAEDNGRGIPAQQIKEGIGLMNIRSRANTVNGELNYEPGHEGGTLVTLRIPV